MSVTAFVIGCVYGSVWTLAVVFASRRGWSDVRAFVRPKFTTLTISDFGSMKIQAIKHVRAFTGLGLKEAKDAVEGSLPLTLARDDATALAKQLRALGASVEGRHVRKAAA